jgi:hypothetical protein
MSSCHYHADRPGVGICMRCRRVLCPACRTRVDGVNHCHACLKQLAGAPPRRPVPRVLSALLALLALGLTWLSVGGVLWLVQGRLAP